MGKVLRGRDAAESPTWARLEPVIAIGFKPARRQEESPPEAGLLTELPKVASLDASGNRKAAE